MNLTPANCALEKASGGEGVELFLHCRRRRVCRASYFADIKAPVRPAIQQPENFPASTPEQCVGNRPDRSHIANNCIRIANKPPGRDARPARASHPVFATSINRQNMFSSVI